MRYPILLKRDQLLEPFKHHLERNLGNVENLRRHVDPIEMILRAENRHPIAPTIRLQPVEDRLTVMQGRIRRRHFDVAVRNDFRIVPTALDIIIHLKHVIGEVRPESDLRYVRLRLQRRCFLNSDLHQLTSPIKTHLEITMNFILLSTTITVKINFNADAPCKICRQKSSTRLSPTSSRGTPSLTSRTSAPIQTP